MCCYGISPFVYLANSVLFVLRVLLHIRTLKGWKPVLIFILSLDVLETLLGHPLIVHIHMYMYVRTYSGSCVSETYLESGEYRNFLPGYMYIRT